MVVVEFIFKGPNGMKHRVKEFNNDRHYKFYRDKIPDVDTYGNKLVGERVLKTYAKKTPFSFTVEEKTIREIEVEANDFESALILLKESVKENNTHKFPGEIISRESLVKSFGKFENNKNKNNE